MKRKSGKGRRVVVAICVGIMAVSFLLPTLLTVTGAFMSRREVADSYGPVFAALGDGADYLERNASFTLLPRDVTGLQFFIVLFQRSDYLLRFWNAVLLVVPIVLGQLAVASMAAYSLSRYRHIGRRLFLFCCIMLMLMPAQVTLVPNYLVAKGLGILDTMRAILYPGIFSPFALFLLTTFMRRIPSSQYEAAKLDGAGEWRLFTRICLPQCRSILYSIAILLFIDYWNMVEQPLVLLSDPLQQPLSIYLSATHADSAGEAFAAAVLYMIPPLLLFLHGEKHLVAGIAHAGASMGTHGGDVYTAEGARSRRWVPAVAVVFCVALAAMTVLSDDNRARVTPQVKVGGASYGLIDDTIYEVAVPPEAVLCEGEHRYVLVLGAADPLSADCYQAVWKEVEVLAENETFAAIDGDVDLFDRVILSYSALPRDGQYVDVAA